VTDRVYRVIMAEPAGVLTVAVDRRDASLHGRTLLEYASPRAVAVASRDRWAVFDDQGGTVRSWSGEADPARGDGVANASRPRAAGGPLCEFVVEAEPCAANAATDRADTRRGPRIEVAGADLAPVGGEPWFAPVSSRTLLAATSTVFGPAAIFSTDRDDEIDVAVSGRGGEALTRTVSLGSGERFDSAVGGGRRILVISRSPGRIVPRTLASDIRSELNPAPIRARTGWEIGSVRAAYANGPFVVAHCEQREMERNTALTVFDGGTTRTSRLLLPRVDGLAVEGKEAVVAAVVSGASAPILLVQRTTVAGGRDRRYAYLLEHPAADTSQARQALLLDAADMLAVSLGADAPRTVTLHEHDGSHDVVQFTLPGPDAGHDLAFSILLAPRGNAVVAVRIGAGRAPEARGLHFAERVREILTGDDDGDPATTRIELPQLATGMASVVSAVGALRASS
jgi:hypothetical protein